MAEQLMTVCGVDDAVDVAVVASARVTLSVDSVFRELDLCSRHLEELRGALANVLSSAPSRTRNGGARTSRRGATKRNARTTPPRRAHPGKPADTASAGDGRAALTHSDEVRQWARGSGLAIKDRGRISNAVVDRYLVASCESAAG